jgi:CDP-paratose 2-epimerase
MKIVIVTGAAGLVGSEAVRFFHARGFYVIGIENDMRKYFFGSEASVGWNLQALKNECKNFTHYDIDIRDASAMGRIFVEHGKDIVLVIHTAAQPSHDWALREPLTDFAINATATLGLLENTRQCCPQAAFIFTSTNKVYGDRPCALPLQEQSTRWELDLAHPYYKKGIDEQMSVDHCQHSLFGASKLAADIMVQEYGRYFGMKTVVFRGGCLTGPDHSGAELHGFLGYLMKCAVTGREYCIFGYKGKQVRDNIHSYDLVNAFDHFFKDPRCGEVYNIGGSRFSHASLLESIPLCEKIAGRKMKTLYVEANRVADHMWWVSDISKFQSHYPAWALTRTMEDILGEIYVQNKARWLKEVLF